VTTEFVHDRFHGGMRKETLCPSIYEF